MKIRNESIQDHAAISTIHREAFKNDPHREPGTGPTEHLIVEELRADHALTLSLVAETEEGVVGHIALSPTTIGTTSKNWFILGPVGVLPDHQGQGVGSVLIREALAAMRANGAHGIVLVGDPAFYERFGFLSLDRITYPGVPQQFVLALPWTEDIPTGDIVHNKAFFAGR